MVGVLWPLLLCTAFATVCDDDAAVLLQKPRAERVHPLALLESSLGHELASHTFMGLICAVLMFTMWEFMECAAVFSQGASTVNSISDQWWLIIMSAMIQVGSSPIFKQLYSLLKFTWLQVKLRMVNSIRKTWP